MLRVVEDAIDVTSVTNSVDGLGFGAVVTFIGCVRATADDGETVSGLTYEAHETMAVAYFEIIAQQLREHYGDVEVAIVHRTGALAVGDVAVAVAVAAPHRREAFAACAEALEVLKAHAPIWKKEHYVRGGSRWRENSR